MQKTVVVTHIGETREGVSKTTGKEWTLTNIDIKWMVEAPGRESYEQSCNATVEGIINRDVLSQYCAQGKEILVTMYVKVRVWENRHYTDVRVYLPKELMLDAKPL